MVKQGYLSKEPGSTSLVIPDWPAIFAPAPILICPEKPACPPTTTPSSN